LVPLRDLERVLVLGAAVTVDVEEEELMVLCHPMLMTPFIIQSAMEAEGVMVAEVEERLS
jgi:hypothetical protein